MQIWVSNYKLVTLPNPILELQHSPLPLLVLRVGSVPQVLNKSVVWVIWTRLGSASMMGRIPFKSLVKGKSQIALNIWYMLLKIFLTITYKHTMNNSKNIFSNEFFKFSKWRLCLQDQMNFENAQILHLMVHMDATCATFHHWNLHHHHFLQFSLLLTLKSHIQDTPLQYLLGCFLASPLMTHHRCFHSLPTH